MDNDRLQELIAAVEAEMKVTIEQANNRIAFLNGKIEALRELAALETEGSTEVDPG